MSRYFVRHKIDFSGEVVLPGLREVSRKVTSSAGFKALQFKREDEMTEDEVKVAEEVAQHFDDWANPSKPMTTEVVEQPDEPETKDTGKKGKAA